MQANTSEVNLDLYSEHMPEKRITQYLFMVFLLLNILIIFSKHLYPNTYYIYIMYIFFYISINKMNQINIIVFMYANQLFKIIKMELLYLELELVVERTVRRKSGSIQLISHWEGFISWTLSFHLNNSHIHKFFSSKWTKIGKNQYFQWNIIIMQIFWNYQSISFLYILAQLAFRNPNCLLMLNSWGQGILFIFHHKGITSKWLAEPCI